MRVVVTVAFYDLNGDGLFYYKRGGRFISASSTLSTYDNCFCCTTCWCGNSQQIGTLLYSIKRY